MNPALAGVALAVAAGAVIAASSREARAALVGLAVVLGLGPFLSDPLPGAAVLGARVVTGVLVVVLIRAAIRDPEKPRLGVGTGWPATAALALGAAIAGIAIAAGLALVQPGDGPPGAASAAADALSPAALALGAGLVAVAVGAAPGLLSREALRSGIGLLLVVQGLVSIRIGVAGPPGDLEQLGIDGFVLALGAAVAMLAMLERRGGAEGQAGPDVGRDSGSVPVPDAHPAAGSR